MTTFAKILEPPQSDLSQKQEFGLWAQTYDQAPNPMLGLEERFLSSVLPKLHGLDVLDIGCGTGRWLARLAASGARSLTGIDSSAEMLHHAGRKLGRIATLLVGDAAALPLANESADIILASFVASYVGDVRSFAKELRRVLRRNGRIYITDVHLETSAAHNWKRGFRAGNQEIQLRTHLYTLPEWIALLSQAGLQAVCVLEPSFGAPELEIFRRNDKLEAFSAVADSPAICIMEYRAAEAGAIGTGMPENGPHLALTEARISLGSATSVVANLAISSDRVESIISPRFNIGAPHIPTYALDLRGYLLLPGLINAHDHLEFGLYPNLGRGPYKTSEEWASDIQQTEGATIRVQQSVPKDVRLWWGAIRNLLCGVTTVCHHNPLHPEFRHDDFPVRVFANFGWAHSLRLDEQLENKFKETPAGVPFVLHLGEGTTLECANEIFQLDKLGALDDRTILVHGLALTSDGIALLNRRHASLVWCPSSNRFLFSRTQPREVLSGVQRLLLGSDSPLTAVGDLLDEVRIADREIGVTAEEIYHMVFDRAADAFRLQDGEGTIRPDGAADLIAVRDKGLTPAETVATLTTPDVELVMVRGRVQLASEELLQRLPLRLRSGLQPLQVESVVRWVRAPLGRLFLQAERALGCGIHIGGKRVRHVCTAWL